ncbi:respiratory nitrate reductase 1 subunit alpha [Citrobacter koseri]|uniref:Respiratory nitrate reductase 1 subunit alpha n=1 Tax=Citrobacter koseri TaxID=545 RepID=A0A2X2WQR8_CITKO|nr:respiratory nitrate reductase 1 subunit alpha [Citrobacter koseri]
MRDFGESLLVYRPPIDTRSVKAVMGEKSNGNPEKALNFLTPHQKWGNPLYLQRQPADADAVARLGRLSG